MIKHVVFFRWKPDTTGEQVAAVETALRTMPEEMPFIRSYQMGSDAGIADGSADFALVAEFDNENDWRTYSDHPEHQRVITELIRPIAASIDRAQFRL